MKLTKNKINLTIFIVAVASVSTNLGVVLFYPSIGWSFYLAFLLLNILSLHYILNLLHMASHRNVVKIKWLNNFIGHFCAIIVGFSFDVFRSTHILHHAFPNDPKKDPDHAISTGGSLWWISFRVFYHDYFFFKRKLYLKDSNLKGYLLDRFVQIVLIIALTLTQTSTIFIFFWLLPLLITGSLYGLYQFYFPHYSTQTIDNWKRSSELNLLQKIILFSVDISSVYHFKHHQKITNNTFYFPIWAYLQDLLQNIPLKISLRDPSYLEYMKLPQKSLK
jgi:beta-carotene hydroxylase